MSRPSWYNPNRRWVLWRTDDAGNSFEIAKYNSHQEAHNKMREFEARGHKQHYYVVTEDNREDA